MTGRSENIWFGYSDTMTTSRHEARLDKSGDCWLWPGGTAGKGYPMCTDGYVHRLMYEQYVGPVPAGLELDHLCDVPLCCNPAHLEAVTHAENRKRSMERRLTCIHGHTYDDAYWITNRTTGVRTRKCRTCQLARVRAARG